MTVETTFPAMGTTIWARTPDESAADAVRWCFAGVEQAASRFDPASELTAVNRSDEDTILLGPVLAGILTGADHVRTATGGLVDPAVGSAVVGWGYGVTFGDIEPPSRAPERAEVGRWHIDRRLLSRPAGLDLDLGGIAKGWAADRAVESGLASVVSAGGDLRSVDPDLVVDVLNPAGGVAVSLAVGVGALATSSTARRTWRVGRTRAHHIIDPRTGSPARSPVVSASVIAATALEAEAGAKAVLLLGRDGLAWAADQEWIGGAVVCWDDGTVYGTGDLEVAA